MDYVREVEKFLIEKRNKGLMIFHRDWLLIEKWEAWGIPIKIVKEGIDSALTGLNFSQKGEFHTVPTLTYCEHQVLKLWKHFKESRVGKLQDFENHREYLPFVEKALRYLQNLCRRLEDDIKARKEKNYAISKELKYWLFSNLEKIEKKVRDNKIAEMGKLEEELERLDNQILNKIKEIIGEKTFLAMKEECEKRLSPYRGRMEGSDYSESLEAMLASRLRREYGLRSLLEEDFYRDF